MLFGRLNADIFSLFSGSNRYLYEDVLIAVYETFFRSDLLFPTQSDVVAAIYGRLGSNPELWREDEAPVELDRLTAGRGRRLRRRRVEAADTAASDEAMARARHIYNRLLVTGWLEETRYGLRVTLDMPPGAMRLAEFLCSLREGLSEQLGGLVIEVKNALEAVRLNPTENAPGLNKAARDAASFGRYLRSVLSALREVDRQILESESVGDRLRYYFEDFVERLLLQDYAAIATTSHPYRFRHRIYAALDAIEDSVVDMGALAEAYLAARLARDLTAARETVFDDLMRIRRVFERIEEAFGRIQQHRSRLETKLRNTVRYAGRRGSGFLQRSEAVLMRLDMLLAGSGPTLAIRGALEGRREPVSPHLLARPRGVRTSITGGILALPVADPLRDLLKRLEREYLDRLAVTPAQVRRFLERRVPPSGSTTAATFQLEDVDDFLAFEALRLAVAEGEDPGGGMPALVSALADAFSFEPTPGALVDNPWLTCGDFRIRRLGASVSVEVRGAG